MVETLGSGWKPLEQRLNFRLHTYTFTLNDILELCDYYLKRKKIVHPNFFSGFRIDSVRVHRAYVGHLHRHQPGSTSYKVFEQA